jgi:hypothetical protein
MGSQEIPNSLIGRYEGIRNLVHSFCALLKERAGSSRNAGTFCPDYTVSCMC